MTGFLALLNGVTAISHLLNLITLVVLVAEILGLIDALTHRPAAYVAAGKQTKLFWTILLGVAGFLTFYTNVVGILGLIGVVAVIVYFVDVRPALRANKGRRDDRHQGPYGPW